MISVARRRGLTRGEVLVLIGVIGILLALLVPRIQKAREAARRARCLGHIIHLGLSFQNVESALGRYPSSCRVKKDALTGQITSMDGWSWCVDVLPYIENRPLWETLDIEFGAPLDHYDDKTHPHTIALGAAPSPYFYCPSFGGDHYIDPATKFEAITNYKAMGATHLESLNVASLEPTTPLYGTPEEHPDGGIYPGSEHGLRAFANDGSSHSILLVETKEQNIARWTVGSEACLVGLPARDVGMIFKKEYDYWHPQGYVPNAFWEESTISPKINRTYLDWDYEKIPYNDGGVAKPSPNADSKAVFYGPSSEHPGVVNHGFAAGNVHSISVKIDAAAYMFLITRNGKDPFPALDRM